MTYGDNKKIFFSMIDEYEPNNQYFTEDEDARTKCARLYDARYFELASYRFSKKVKEYEIKETGRGYEKFKLPNGTNIKNLGGRNEYNEPISMESRIEGEYIVISKETEGKLLLEYEPFPTHITEETPDDFELELDDELAQLLPYGVACDLFKTDPGEDYKAFEQEYERRLERIKVTRTSMSANVTGGVL